MNFESVNVITETNVTRAKSSGDHVMQNDAESSGMSASDRSENNRQQQSYHHQTSSINFDDLEHSNSQTKSRYNK